MPNSIGCIIAQRLCVAISHKIDVNYKELEEIVYGELNRISDEQSYGDWLEFPTGTTYTLTFHCATPNRDAGEVRRD